MAVISQLIESGILPEEFDPANPQPLDFVEATYDELRQEARRLETAQDRQKLELEAAEGKFDVAEDRRELKESAQKSKKAS